MNAAGRKRAATRVGCLGMTYFVASCTAANAPRPWAHPTAEQWEAAKDRLARLRSALPQHPYTESIATSLHEPRSGRILAGRGAVAVAPGRAVRRILVGGTGSTLLDAWVTPTAFRIAVPPVDLVRRGGAEEPQDLPVGFLRWWLVGGLDGALIGAAWTTTGPLWLLRHENTVAEVVLDTSTVPERLSAFRRHLGRSERVDEWRRGLAPGAGDHVHYADENTGLEVDITVESLVPVAPQEAAFLDPDDPGSGS